MAHGRPLYLYYLDGWDYLFKPTQANRVDDRVDLVRQNYYTLRIQAVKSTDFSLTSTLQAPAANGIDLSGYSDAIFGFKTSANFSSGGDYAAAWRGWNTTDTTWHSLSNGRGSIDIAPTTTLSIAQYSGVIRLLNGTQYLDIPDLPLYINVRLNGVIGTEPSTPSGSLNYNSGLATITAGQTSKTVAFTGMTSGAVVFPSLINVSELTTISVTPATGQFTINIGATYSTDISVAYLVTSL